MIKMWNRETVTRSVQKTPRRITVAALKRTLLTLVSIGMDKTKRVEVNSSTRIRRRWQNILTKLPGVIGRARKATVSFEAWNYLITGKLSDKIFQHTNQYILIVQPTFCHDSDARLRDKIEIKAVIGLLWLARALWGTKQLLQELWVTDGDGVETYIWVMNQRRFYLLKQIHSWINWRCI
jgi:hypothetical protein